VGSQRWGNAQSFSHICLSIGLVVVLGSPEGEAFSFQLKATIHLGE